MALSVGDRFGPFEVVAPLGAGGMGQVYRARDSRLGREVALKILSDLIASPAIDGTAAVSPDGAWVAYQSNVSGRMEVYVQRFPQAVDRDTISTEGGSSPRWSANGRELFYQSVDGRQVYAVDVTPGPKLTAGRPRLVLEGRFVPAGPNVRPFEVLPDGRFLLIKPEPLGDSNAGPTVVIVQNWLSELKRLLSGAQR